MQTMSNQTVYWKTREGKLISIDDMDINHLRNTLKMIVRSSSKAPKVNTTITLCGDISELINEKELEDHYYPSDDDWYQESVNPPFKTFEGI